MSTATMNSDKHLQTDVLNELNWAPGVDAAHIGVSAQDGAVTLTGHVISYAAKMEAVKAAERVFAVRAVADELEVQLPASHKHDDSTIAQAIAHTFKWNVAVPNDVDAKVSKRWVTLTGKVDSMFERQAAEHAVEYQTGVLGVSNLIEIKKRPKAADVQTQINSAFHRNASLDARRIQVSTDNGTVHLYGNVHSVQELRAARQAAYAAPGVASVDNHLHVTP
jgi:osmotically-inducible protein OsmY